MKYAIVALNHKILTDTEYVRRRVLISYEDVMIERDPKSKRYLYRQYTGVRVVAKDPYFTDNEEHTLHYEFPENSDSVIVISVVDGQRCERFRPYYSIPVNAYRRDSFLIEYQDLYRPREFECNSDSDALLLFELDN